MKLVVAVILGFMLLGCSERPKGDVCHQIDDVSMFMCESSKQYFEGEKLENYLAFYVSSELKERAVPNLTETLSRLANSSSQIDIGGKDSLETRKVVLAAVENLVREDVNLNGVQVMYLGPAIHKNIISASFKQLGARILYVEYGQ